ncbi:hypothetical protein [Bifidobacterium jacchi]|uniref:hypothetical protein n=1 Tax=Bifidobacterium jacchi TaxID=2490545 RepID=UPI001F4F1442|nr:hypothetical protein [Bifidobacterium jacchi]
MSDVNDNETFTFNEDEIQDTAADERPAQSQVCGKAAHCPVKRCLGLCDGAGKCPVRNISKSDAIAGVVTLISMGIVIAVSCYAQYALTKAAVKSALKQTRLR